MKAGDRIEVRAESIAESGAGITSIEDREINVPGLAPGESAFVQVEAVSRHHARAFARTLSRLGNPSPDRQDPPCPGYGRCGGCAWQHLSYPAQLAHKHRRLRDALAGVVDPDLIAEPLPAPTEIGYRNKASYVLGRRRADNSLLVGARVPRSADIVDTRGCQIVEPVIDATANGIAALIDDQQVVIDSPLKPPGGLRYLLVRSTPDGQVAVALVTRGDADMSRVRTLAAAVAELDNVCTVAHIVNDETSGALVTDIPPVPIVGSGVFREPFADAEVDVGLDSFLQVNRTQAQRMCQLVADAAVEAGVKRAVDLYCGLGAVGFYLASRGIEVIGVERSADAVRAQEAAQRTELPIKFARADAGQTVDLAVSIDLVVVNPPRKGLSQAARDRVAELHPSRIHYLSCGPDSLARDLADFGERGFRVRRVQPVDLMPGTAQIETFVELERA